MADYLISFVVPNWDVIAILAVWLAGALSLWLGLSGEWTAAAMLRRSLYALGLAAIVSSAALTVYLGISERGNWAYAVQDGSSEAFLSYLKSYPESTHKADAVALIRATLDAATVALDRASLGQSLSAMVLKQVARQERLPFRLGFAMEKSGALTAPKRPWPGGGHATEADFINKFGDDASALLANTLAPLGVVVVDSSSFSDAGSPTFLLRVKAEPWGAYTWTSINKGSLERRSGTLSGVRLEVSWVVMSAGVSLPLVSSSEQAFVPPRLPNWTNPESNLQILCDEVTNQALDLLRQDLHLQYLPKSRGGTVKRSES